MNTIETTIIGESMKMRLIRNLIERISAADCAVLILGESGTGKELIARATHEFSSRKKNPFVSVNCAAIPEMLIESELLGHERGAFTGADHLRRGKFEAAHTGTLFLDEIGDLSLPAQAKILRVLQEKKFERLGGCTPVSADVRIIAATNRNLPEMICRKLFREDLFYRLNVLPIALPPLRGRGDDVVYLAHNFTEEFCRKYQRPLLRITDDAIRVLYEYRWPGNVRELRNLIERVVVLSLSEHGNFEIDGNLLCRHINVESMLEMSVNVNAICSGMSNENSVVQLDEAVRSFEKNYILTMIERLGGNVSNTAKILGVSRSNLYRKLKLLNTTESLAVA